MNKKLVAAAVAAVLCTGVALTASAQVKPDILVKQRTAAMTLQGKYFGPLGAMAQGKAPYNGDVVARNAGFLEALSKMPWDGFDASTKGEKTKALPEVFSDAAGFKTAADNLQSTVSKLAAASKGGNEAAVKAAIGDVGKACGGCHDKYRQKAQ